MQLFSEGTMVTTNPPGRLVIGGYVEMIVKVPDLKIRMCLVKNIRLAAKEGGDDTKDKD